jgi:outer membrane protein OmpA-like peptidoglycan-associated protein
MAATGKRRVLLALSLVLCLAALPPQTARATGMPIPPASPKTAAAYSGSRISVPVPPRVIKTDRPPVPPIEVLIPVPPKTPAGHGRIRQEAPTPTPVAAPAAAPVPAPVETPAPAETAQPVETAPPPPVEAAPEVRLGEPEPPPFTGTPPTAITPDTLFGEDLPPPEAAPVETASLPPAPADGFVPFASKSDHLDEAVEARLSEIAERMAADQRMRLELRGYSADQDGSLSDTRRLSLRRVLAVRDHLVLAGVAITRIDILALGVPPEGGDSPQDRVDLIFQGASRP